MAESYINYTTVEKLRFELGTNSDRLLEGLSETDIKSIINRQSRVLDDLLQSVKTVPFDSVEETNSNLPHIVSELCLSFCKYKIWNRKAFKDIPENIQKEYEAAYKIIEKIQNGKITIGPAEDFSEEETEIDEQGGIKDKFRWEAKTKYFTEDV